MEHKNKILAILAIFCVLLSVCAVSAADYVSENGVVYDLDDGYDDYDLDDGYDDDLDDDDDIDADDIHDSMILPPDYAHNESAMMNTTNTTGHAAGENVVSNATSNVTASAHTMHATGNPIIALLAVGAVLGGACVLRRK